MNLFLDPNPVKTPDSASCEDLEAFVKPYKYLKRCIDDLSPALSWGYIVTYQGKEVAITSDGYSALFAQAILDKEVEQIQGEIEF